VAWWRGSAYQAGEQTGEQGSLLLRFGGPRLAFRPYLTEAFRVSSMEASAARLRASELGREFGSHERDVDRELTGPLTLP